jgi:uncharacterized protein (DUF2141 family)
MIKPFGLNLLFLTIAVSVGVVRGAEAQPEGRLTIEVNALRNQEGNVCLKLFASGEGFPNNDDYALQITCVPIAPDPVTESSASGETPTSLEPATESSDDMMADQTVLSGTIPGETPSSSESAPDPVASTPLSFRYSFENLPYGTYAVAIYHDRNRDERLNRGLFGMPEEGYGFSNDAPASFGPADFDDAVFALETLDTTIQIKMRYP